MPKALSTGIPQLDHLMGGGLVRGALHIVVGDPGSGKTILAHQIAASVGKEEGTVLYLTSLIEVHGTLQVQAENLEFFDPSLVGTRLYYASIYPAFAERGFDGVRAEILALLAQHDPALIVLDGLHVLRTSAVAPARYNEFLGAMQALAASTGVTVLMIANHPPGDSTDAMFSISDGILALGTEERGAGRARRLEVRKLRTVGPITGKHAYEITGRGIEVYPRLEALAGGIDPDVPAPPSGRPHAFGIEGLDGMLGGGVAADSATLVVGASGCGKTSLGLAYLTAGLARGERGVFLGFHEFPERLVAKAEAIELGLAERVRHGDVRFIRHTAAEVPADRLAHALIDTADELTAARVVIDGMDDFIRRMSLEGRGVGFINGLLDLLRIRGISVLMTMEIADVFSLGVTLPTDEVSAAVDNIILLRAVEEDSGLRHLVSMLKVRDRDADAALRELVIGPDGISVGDRFTAGRRRMRGRGPGAGPRREEG